jgi:hypothetical protein
VGLLVGGGVSGDWLNVPNQTVNPNVSSSVGTGASLPTLSTSGSASGSFVDWGAAITVRQPLYDGGLARESIALAQRRAAQAEITVQQAQQAIIQSVETWFATHRAAASQTRAARAAITAGKLVARITTEKKGQQMPPPYSGLTLTAKEKQTLTAFQAQKRYRAPRRAPQLLIGS